MPFWLLLRCYGATSGMCHPWLSDGLVEVLENHPWVPIPQPALTNFYPAHRLQPLVNKAVEPAEPTEPPAIVPHSLDCDFTIIKASGRESPTRQAGSQEGKGITLTPTPPTSLASCNLTPTPTLTLYSYILNLHFQSVYPRKANPSPEIHYMVGDI
jgi:hypothetical protein